jgi:hypothetical protein
MVEKALSKAFEKVRNLIAGVEKGQADDAPIDLPGTHKRRDTSGQERVADTDSAPNNPANPHGSGQTETPESTR